ncbi:NRR repressor homolog 3-like [Ananas comosus]|uniref:NRR repressor homolog 3-like n=1 Tax=Ananas comosus TaxID=4615 RepID=A0A6P5EIZ7_ANACO|nr:NRR repressor homolog 3-like [Ananas comosus]XP_020081469.1 NRR repressor homolog 3-like [Ananas comosus]
MNSALIDMEEESYGSSRKRSAAGAAAATGPNYPCAAKGKAVGKREEEEELGEEMDKFSALLGNLRALKDVFRRQHGDAGGSTSSKRLRTEEEEAPPPLPPPPPLPTWRPTFQLEDFKHPSGNEKEEGKLRKDEENHLEQRLQDGASLDLSLAL